MKRLSLLLRDIEFFRSILPALFLGASLGVFVHGYWLVDLFPIGSRSLFFFTLLVGLVGVAGYLLLFRWMTDALYGLSNLQKAGVIAGSLLVGTFLFFTATGNWHKPDRYISLFLPAHTLEISAPAGLDGEVSILWMTSSLGDTSYETIDYKGWELEKDRLVLKNYFDNHFHWVGKTGDEVQIVFDVPSKGGYVLLSWDGQEETLQFSKKKNSYVRTFEIPFYASQGMTLLLGILNFALFSFPLCFMVWKRRVGILQTVRRDLTSTVQHVDRREWIVVLAVIALALVLRVPSLENLFPNVEEYSHINTAKEIVQGSSPMDVAYQRSMWLVTFPVSIMFRIFGYKLWAARLLGVIFNVLALIPLYLLARRMNRTIATLSLLLFATSPWMIAVSRAVREYAYYPFYFFWIVYGMALLLDKIPDRFHMDRDWRIIFKPKVLFLLFVLAIPPFYSFYVDIMSTFKLILIAYAVFGVFIVLKLDLRHSKNLPVILLLAGVGLAGIGLIYYRFPLDTAVNLIPLNYFFSNPLQQFYFDRAGIVLLLGLLGTVAIAVLLRRENSMPLFLLAIYGCFLAFFMFSSNRFFAPRHLSTTQLWYVILMAVGLYLIWVFLCTLPFFEKKGIRILTVFVLLGAVVNVQQVLLPLTSRDPAMPITEAYHNDLTDLHSYMLAHVKTGDVLISSRIYTRYVEWVGEPVFREIYEFRVDTTEGNVLSIVDQYDSGWIIIDNARIERAVFSPGAVFLDNDRIEYVGLFDDEHVWRWRAK